MYKPFYPHHFSPHCTVQPGAVSWPTVFRVQCLCSRVLFPQLYRNPSEYVQGTIRDRVLSPLWYAAEKARIPDQLRSVLKGFMRCNIPFAYDTYFRLQYLRVRGKPFPVLKYMICTDTCNGMISDACMQCRGTLPDCGYHRLLIVPSHIGGGPRT